MNLSPRWSTLTVLANWLSDMGKRISGLDTLGEVRRALRILRRTERWLMQCERDEKRRGVRERERQERERARRKPTAAELASQG